MNREFALSLLTEKRELLKKIISYNELDTKVEFPESIKNSSYFQKFEENHSLLRKLAPVKSSFFDFENPFNRFVFFQEDVFNRLSKLLSACICSKILVSDIKKEQVHTYKEFLGEDVYLFGLRRGSLYLSEPVKKRLVSRFESNENAVMESGYAVLNALFKKATPECREQLVLKDIKVKDIDLTDKEESILFDCIKKILCREIDESCQNIFS